MAEVKKVAFVHGEFPDGGAERVTCDIATELFKRGGYEVYVLTRKFNSEMLPADLAYDKRFHVIASPVPNVSNFSEIPIFIIDNVRANGISSVVFVAQHLYDVVDELKRMGCHTIYANHGPAFWEVTDRRQCFRLKARKSCVHFIKYYLFKYLRYEVLHVLEHRWNKRYKLDFDYFDDYMVLCDGYRNQIVHNLKLSPADASRIHVIPNMQQHATDLCYDKCKEFLFVGRLSFPDKRVDRLVDAWRMIYDKLPDWSLVIVGDGPDRKRLETMAKGLPRLSFEGYQKPDEYYRRASASCLVSEYEGFPLCLIEAQSHGVVPITMNSSEGVCSIVGNDGSAGMLVPKGNVRAFADKMLEFAALDEDAKLRLRHQVVAKSLEYSPERVGQMWVDLL